LDYVRHFTAVNQEIAESKGSRITPNHWTV